MSQLHFAFPGFAGELSSSSNADRTAKEADVSKIHLMDLDELSSDESFYTGTEMSGEDGASVLTSVRLTGSAAEISRPLVGSDAHSKSRGEHQTIKSQGVPPAGTHRHPGCSAASSINNFFGSASKRQCRSHVHLVEPEDNQGDRLQQLPEELLMDVLELLTPQDWCALLCVSRLMRGLALQAKLWISCHSSSAAEQYRTANWSQGGATAEFNSPLQSPAAYAAEVERLGEQLQADIESVDAAVLQLLAGLDQAGLTEDVARMGTTSSFNSKVKGASGEPFTSLIARKQVALYGLLRATAREIKGTANNVETSLHLPQLSIPENTPEDGEKSLWPLAALTAHCAANLADPRASATSVAAGDSEAGSIAAAVEGSAGAASITTSVNAWLQHFLTQWPHVTAAVIAARGSRDVASWVDAKVAAAFTTAVQKEMRKRPTGLGTRLRYSGPSLEGQCTALRASFHSLATTVPWLPSHLVAAFLPRGRPLEHSGSSSGVIGGSESSKSGSSMSGLSSLPRVLSNCRSLQYLLHRSLTVSERIGKRFGSMRGAHDQVWIALFALWMGGYKTECSGLQVALVKVTRTSWQLAFESAAAAFSSVASAVAFQLAAVADLTDSGLFLWEAVLAAWRRYCDWLTAAVPLMGRLESHVNAEQTAEIAVRGCQTTPSLDHVGRGAFRSEVLLSYGLRGRLQAALLQPILEADSTMTEVAVATGSEPCPVNSAAPAATLEPSIRKMLRELDVPDDTTASRDKHTRRKMRAVFGLEPHSAADLTLHGSLRVPQLL